MKIEEAIKQAKIWKRIDTSNNVSNAILFLDWWQNIINKNNTTELCSKVYFEIGSTKFIDAIVNFQNDPIWIEYQKNKSIPNGLAIDKEVLSFLKQNNLQDSKEPN